MEEYEYCEDEEGLEVLLEMEAEELNSFKTKRKLNFDYVEGEEILSTSRNVDNSVLPHAKHIKTENDMSQEMLIFKERPFDNYITVTNADKEIFFLKIKPLKLRTKTVIQSYHTQFKAVYDSIEKKEYEKHLPQKRSRSSYFVGKYPPIDFKDLITPEYVNRELLTWIKQWERIVYKKTDARKNYKEILSPGFVNIFLLLFLATPKRNEKAKENENLQHPILLLAGPSGCGKSTAVKIIARHAGYQVDEISSGDDRSLGFITNKIKTLCTNQSYLSKKPTLLILDDIDTISEQAIVDLITSGFTSGKNKEKDEDKKEKKRKGTFSLIRPIIAICNNPYIPTLHSLRLISKFLNITSIDTLTHHHYLTSISKKENIHIDYNSISKIINNSPNDIRASLNMLQMTSYGTVKLDGTKDGHFDYFTVLSSLLSSYIISDSSSSSYFPIEKLASMIFSFNDNDKLLAGLFTNYINFINDFNKIETVLEYFLDCDRFISYSRHFQDFVLESYFPYLVITCPFNSSNHYRNTKLLLPKYDTDSNLDIVRILKTRISPNTFILDIQSPLMSILHPRTISRSPSLYQISKIANIMKWFELTYFADNSASSLTSPNISKYILSPPLNRFSFDASYSLPNTVRKMILDNLDNERLHLNVQKNVSKEKIIDYNSIEKNFPVTNIAFSYNEGFTNAVIMKLKISNFI